MSPLKIIVPVWLALVCSGEDPLVVPTPSGKIRGVTVGGIEGRTVDAFLGIPYGAPTGGQNRFSPPKEASPLDGVFDASQFSKPCHQALPESLRNYELVSNKEETEDCLKLNIWVPKSEAKSRAVLVWIHGGGFYCGSSDVPLYNGASLASQEDVIVVSLNYRLSIFGFLYLAHPLAPGNMGLMDQTLGLQWVQKNIQAFGGDPMRVTIFGESAGGSSVGFQLVSSASSDLFQNAILQSGAANNPWASSPPEDILEKSLLFANKSGCPVREDGREETVRCLQERSHEKLVEVVLTYLDPIGTMIFRPVVDGNYLSASAAELLSQGKFSSQKNVLLGFTKDDGSVLVPAWASEGMLPEKLASNEEELKKILSFIVGSGTETSGPPLEVVCHTYTEWNPAFANYTLTLDGVIRAATDHWFGCPTISTADLVAQKGNSVFLYLYNHLSETNRPSPSWLGVQHASEIPYLFGHVTPDGNNQEDVRVSKRIMHYWANFAKTGNPNDYYLPHWDKYTNQNKEYLEISGKDMKMEKVRQLKDCFFWENVFPKIGCTHT